MGAIFSFVDKYYKKIFDYKYGRRIEIWFRLHPICNGW